MQASGRWMSDLHSGRRGDPADSDHETLLLGHRAPWKSDAGRFALNRGIPVDSFDRLNVNANGRKKILCIGCWWSVLFKDRLCLSLQVIQSRSWGIGLDIGAVRDTRFTLRAPTDKRSGSLYWLGTPALTMCTCEWRSNLWWVNAILLRSDQAAGDDVSILFSKGKWRSSKTEIQRRSLWPACLVRTSSPIPLSPPFWPSWDGNWLWRQRHPLVALESLSEPTSNKGMIRLVVQDSLKGVGEARSVRIVCTPLGKK